MTKKSKFMSWLGFGKSDKKEAEQKAAADKQQALAQEEAQKLEQEKLAQQAETERLQAEAEAERLEQERIAAEQIEAKRLEQEKLAQEQAEAERLKAEAETERLEQERIAAEKIEAKRSEQEKLAQEQAEAERLKAEAETERLELERIASEQIEAKRLEQERAENAEKIAIEQANAELLAKQQADAEAQRQEHAQRLADQETQMLLEQERLAAEKIEAERLEQIRLEKKDEAVKAEKLAIEQANAELLAKEQADAEAQRQDQAKRLAEQEAQMRLEQERIAADKAESERLEQERITAEKAQNERLEQERIAAEKTQSERLEQERITAEKVEKPKKEGFFSRLKKGLLKTRVNIGSGFASIFSGKKIDDELFEDLETQLLTADLGVDTTMKLIDSLTDAANRKQLKDGDALYELMKQEMAAMLKTAEQPLVITKDKKPFVILMVGVNGVGKTTTIGKMAKQFQSEGKSVMLAAGDTFRAAAVEQLQVWGERNSIPVIAQHTGADSASVVFDAFQAAKARNIDVLIADTAGRLQNKDNLMQELEKIARVMKKIDPDAPHEVMLTIDAGTGQNAISQVNLFNQCVGLTGITLSKLDGTAKGGVIFAVADKFNIPIRYIGVGEGIDDLRAFKSDDFIDALFSQDEDDV
ncbi:signal recognition particle-docking protein FtsY [Pseudoalteromonas sp. SWYJZ19]|uniref:signal recognition particle-docking protein FtsY n=1 Tax=Pseudoalteromonas sp. SWYJZ19 TaxID=2792068 RepID=UPI0018CD4868|nr:signal recognition particle-docking protein FtsY [Pseudoalteromonas sp. SWYJZ19]MBH0050250.1 signal recognition particle-docking protein FtsY [Pseudoalteromonas sp. SWYJZ19]